MKQDSPGWPTTTATASARGIVVAIVKLSLVLTAMSVTGQVLKFSLGWSWLGPPVRFFDLNREGNLPTLYQAATLLLCAALLWAIADARRRAAAPYAAHWRGLALIFAYLCCDEMFRGHEHSIEFVRNRLRLDGFLFYAWVVPGAVFVLLVALVYVRFVFYLPGDVRALFVLAAVLYVGGALGMELVGGKMNVEYGHSSPQHAVAAQVEEVLEMSGVIVFIHALLTYARSHLDGPLGFAGRTFRLA